VVYALLDQKGDMAVVGHGRDQEIEDIGSFAPNTIPIAQRLFTNGSRD
jgi:hypothetical protein